MIWKTLKANILKKINLKNKNSVQESYNVGLNKVRNNLEQSFSFLNISNKKIDNHFFNKLEQIFIESDMSFNVASKLINDIKKEIKKNKTVYINETKQIIIDSFLNFFAEYEKLNFKLKLLKNKLNVYLIVGVNGSGKTTTIAKLAYYFKNNFYKKVLVVPGDTFRAGAVEQLNKWCKNNEIDFFSYDKNHKESASVIYQGITFAKKNNYDIVICDTSGRLHSNKNLMLEMQKINKIINKLLNEQFYEKIIVLDGTSGQNTIQQMSLFNKYINDLSGIIITKMDGTSKGGFLLSIVNEYKIPIKFIGFGEKITDLKQFNLSYFLYNLLKHLE